MKKSQLNTGVKITDKGGNTYVYDTIEKASEMTQMSVQTLKIRANKNSIPKDGIQVEWLDEHTKRSYSAKRSKQKGSKLELDVIHKLNELGYNTVSSRSNSRLLDNNKVDICDLDGNLCTYIQCKATQSTPSYFKIAEECSLKDKWFSIIWKKQDKDGGQSPGTVAIIPLDMFYDYLNLKLIK